MGSIGSQRKRGHSCGADATRFGTLPARHGSGTTTRKIKPLLCSAHFTAGLAHPFLCGCQPVNRTVVTTGASQVGRPHSRS
jgi:hypothetical protein